MTIRRLTRKLLADGETAVGLYRKLAHDRPGTFLLESAENGRSWSRYSFVGVRSAATLTERDGRAVWIGAPPPGVPTEGEPLQVLAATVEALREPRDASLPPLVGGMVGFVAYDAVRRLERLPDDTVDDLGLPELVMFLVTDLAVLDHHDGSVLLIANVLPGDSEPDAERRLDEMTAALQRPAPSTVAVLTTVPTPAPVRRTSSAQYMAWVERAREYIKAGDIFQVVPSQRFEAKTSVSALDIYRVLRARNPSPYLYLLRFDGFDVVGSSPEAHVTVKEGRALMHPIAGSRPRGGTPEDDNALATEMLADPKERAEHVMLVDLARNDLGRVCAPGSVEVVDFMSVERYSHIMHIVSTVVGQLDPSHDALDVLPRPSRRAPCRAHPRCVRWRSSRSSSRHAGASTAGWSATSTLPAILTPRSRSAPRSCATARFTCRRAPGWSPTPTQPAKTPNVSTRPTPCCRPSRSQRRCGHPTSCRERAGQRRRRRRPA